MLQWIRENKYLTIFIVASLVLLSNGIVAALIGAAVVTLLAKLFAKPTGKVIELFQDGKIIRGILLGVLILAVCAVPLSIVNLIFAS